MSDPRRRLRLALPFTILTEPGIVRLVAGEDIRYTLTEPGLDSWLPGVFSRLADHPVGEAVAHLAPEFQGTALRWLERLQSERILSDAPVEAAHPAGRYRLETQGTGRVWELLRGHTMAALQSQNPSPQPPPRSGEGEQRHPSPQPPPRSGEGEEEAQSCSPVRSEQVESGLHILCQDRLDYQEALTFNRRWRAGGEPWLWVSTGALQRGYVSPIFLPAAGPCLECLIRHFQRLSPAPEIYTALMEHGRQGRPFEAVPFPEEGCQVLAQLVLWKASLLRSTWPLPAGYRLHVLELETFEISTHRVWQDPGCPACGRPGCSD